MPQSDALRLQLSACRELTSSIDSVRQTLTNTGYFKIGDVVDIYDKDSAGCLGTSQGTRTINGICPNEAIVFDSTFDTSSFTGTPTICNRSLQNLQDAHDRWAECHVHAQNRLIWPAVSITAHQQDTPIVGQMTVTLPSDAICFDTGDSYQVICDSGIVISGTVVSNDLGLNEIILDDSADLTSETNCKLVGTSLTEMQLFSRLKSSITSVRKYGHHCGVGNCNQTVFKLSEVFVQDSLEVHADAGWLKRGTCGTLADDTQGAGNSEVTFTSRILNTNGNSVQWEYIAGAGAPVVTVTGDFPTFTVTITGDSAGTATAQDVADAINASAAAELIGYAIYGGDGTGVLTPFAATALTGGLNDATYDFCELEQVVNNVVTASGYRYFAMNIRDETEPNRWQSPPRDSEEMSCSYNAA